MSWKKTLVLGTLSREKCSRSRVSWGLGNALGILSRSRLSKRTALQCYEMLSEK